MLKELTIAKFASIRKPISIPLGRTTLILGDNDTGKTAICDAISCLFDYQSAYSARGRFSEDAFLQGTVVLDDCHEIQVEREFKLLNNQVVIDDLRVNGAETSDFDSLSSILKVVYFDDRLLTHIKSGRDLAKYCLSYLSGWHKGLSKHHLLSLKPFAKLFNSMPNRMIEAIEWLASGELRVNSWNKDFWVRSFEGMSGGERCKLFIEMTLAIGHLFSKYRTTLILLDNILTHLDSANIKAVSVRTGSITNPNLQVLFTTWKEETDLLLLPDCTIQLSKGELGTKISFERRTPRGILHVEERVKSFCTGKEDEFINTVIIPLLMKMGFSLVSKVQHHGPGELGLDIGPFSGVGFEWRKALCGAQIKCSKQNARSGSNHNINALIDEVKKALHNHFFDMTCGLDSKLDYVFVFLSQYPTKEAVNTFNDAFLGERRVVLLEPIRIAELVCKYGVPI